MTYNEILDGIACKRWPALEQIVIDIEILRRGGIKMMAGGRRFCCVVGFSVMAYSEFMGDSVLLLCGVAFVMFAIMGALDQRRRNRVDAWLNEAEASVQ